MTARPIIMGVDLSGPSNHADTACAVFERQGDTLMYRRHLTWLGDADLLHVVDGASRGASLTIGLDAPLSYQDGGGDRVRDRELRTILTKAGMPSGTVMTPTMTRMAYLTLRGVSLSRMIASTHSDAAIVEVHPFGSLALAGAPVADLTAVKKDAAARERIASWLTDNGMDGLPNQEFSDHELAAFGAAWAAWKWQSGTAAWTAPAEIPSHPFAFAC